MSTTFYLTVVAIALLALLVLAISPWLVQTVTAALHPEGSRALFVAPLGIVTTALLVELVMVLVVMTLLAVSADSMPWFSVVAMLVALALGTLPLVYVIGLQMDHLASYQPS